MSDENHGCYSDAYDGGGYDEYYDDDYNDEHLDGYQEQDARSDGGYADEFSVHY
jgi:hypothetical protein